MVQAEKQPCRPMEQNRIYNYSHLLFGEDAKMYTGEKIAFSINGLRKLDVHIQKKDIRHLFY